MYDDEERLKRDREHRKNLISELDREEERRKERGRNRFHICDPIIASLMFFVEMVAFVLEFMLDILMIFWIFGDND